VTNQFCFWLKKEPINKKAEKLTVVFVESASDWLDVPFD